MSDGVRHVLLVFSGAILGGAVFVVLLVLAIIKGGHREPGESLWDFYNRARTMQGVFAAMAMVPVALILLVIKLLW